MSYLPDGSVPDVGDIDRPGFHVPFTGAEGYQSLNNYPFPHATAGDQSFQAANVPFCLPWQQLGGIVDTIDASSPVTPIEVDRKLSVNENDVSYSVGVGEAHVEWPYGHVSGPFSFDQPPPHYCQPSPHDFQPPQADPVPNDQQPPINHDTIDEAVSEYSYRTPSSSFQTPGSIGSQPSPISDTQQHIQHQPRRPPPNPKRTRRRKPSVDASSPKTTSRRNSTPAGSSHENLQERNRLAASRFRVRKREDTSRLQSQEAEMVEHHRQLCEGVDQLTREVYELKMELLRHSGCDCALIKDYIRTEAHRYVQTMSGELPAPWWQRRESRGALGGPAG